MTQQHPFLLLMGRASVLWIGAAVLTSLAFILLVLGQPDELLTPYINVAFLAALGYPMACGWLGGAIIQEFQHCTCAWALPAVNRRLASGYLMTGFAIAVLIAILVSQSRSNNLGFITLLVLTMVGYCLGGTLFDPLRPWMGSVSLVVALLIVARSRHLSDLLATYQGEAIIVSMILGALSLSRLFSRSILRHRPFNPTSPFPGSFSVERSAEFEREKLAREKPRTTGWKSGYLDARTWSWVRAAIYESYGSVGWKSLIKIPGRLWALGLVFAIHAWANRGSLSFGQALGRTMHDALLQSPHVPPLVERGEHSPLVILIVGAIGVALVLSGPSCLLRTSLAYPISRRLHAAVAFRGGLVDITVFSIGLSVVLALLGVVCGWLVGYDIRFDYIPFFLRPVAVTAVLMPLALWGNLHLLAAKRRREENTVVAVVFAIIGFVAAVWIGTALVPRVFPSSAVGAGVLAAVLVGSLLIYRSKLYEYFSKADVA